MDDEGVYHIVPSALRGTRGGRGIVSIDVEAEVRLLEGVSPTEPARIRVVVSPTTSTWVGLIALPLASLGLGVVQLFQRPPSIGGFTVLLAFAGVLALIGWWRASSVVARAWPGLMVEVERLAEGTLYVPAA